MHSSGILRPVDRNGRVVIPKELHKQIGIVDKEDSFEIFVEGDMIILRKYNPKCIFCGQEGDVMELKGQKVCLGCIDRLTAMKNSL